MSRWLFDAVYLLVVAILCAERCPDAKVVGVRVEILENSLGEVVQLVEDHIETEMCEEKR